MKQDLQTLEEKYQLIYPLLEPGEEVRVITQDLFPNIIPERYFVTSYGRAFSFKSKNQLIQLTPEPIYHNSIGQRIQMRNIFKNPIRLSIYRLVLIVFNPVNNMENLEVKHIDGNPANNKLSNLEWREGSYLNYIQDPRNPIVDFSSMELFPNEVVLPITEREVPDIKPIYFISNY